MNDESNFSTDANEAALPTSDPHSPPTKADAQESLCPAAEPPLGADEALDRNFEMPADPVADPDPDCQGAAAATEADGLDKLRGELKELQDALRERDAKLLRLERLDRDFTEFAQLYPDVSVAQISPDVWQAVEQGSSLAAAYALAERRQAMLQKQAQTANESNRARSAGALHNAESLEYSPAEVRAMSAREVRDNLPKIMRSMQKWS